MFSSITFKDIIDILLVALMAFYAYHLLRKSGAVNLFWGLLFFVAAWFLTSYVFHLQLTGALFNQIVSVGAIAIIVIFQSEIRAFFYSVGAHVGQGIPFGKLRQQQDLEHTIHELQTALLHMSASRTGALIVITGQQKLDEYVNTGETIDATISARLLENIFFKNSPLHDGAVFITHSRIRSAACILPVSSFIQLPQQFGLRHRAAAGIAETTDATVLVVSEETGTIALAQRNSVRIVPEQELYATLKELLK
ncbi:MAG: diadenylate cyclase CdaA [Paludibacteraceae bacterium]|nr:diadenylate cyclase CdaA [Paludibacteraceae bacterium]